MNNLRPIDQAAIVASLAITGGLAIATGAAWLFDRFLRKTETQVLDALYVSNTEVDREINMGAAYTPPAFRDGDRQWSASTPEEKGYPPEPKGERCSCEGEIGQFHDPDCPVHADYEEPEWFTKAYDAWYEADMPTDRKIVLCERPEDGWMYEGGEGI